MGRSRPTTSIPSGNRRPSSARDSSLYNLACVLARLGRKDDALEAASRAVDAGFKARTHYERDPDLAPLRGDPRFERLIATLPSSFAEQPYP